VASTDVDQPRAIQAPGVNDTVARSIVTRVEEIATVVAKSMEKMDSMDVTDAGIQLEKLKVFTG
jgi:hypothetical protein